MSSNPGQPLDFVHTDVDISKGPPIEPVSPAYEDGMSSTFPTEQSDGTITPASPTERSSLLSGTIPSPRPHPDMQSHSSDLDQWINGERLEMLSKYGNPSIDAISCQS
jgi:hypothetical protein